ncbi:hypothetical protein D8674_004096 [Pyrus ussuriensis x Pyrus communis]|uniref:Uncharacterized protein n=1 Tax=Pyrus ussuriensis x Pyrus communis TaxID=2448454 RepID=A0A5N5FN41_9ROSA|nr:hypothetical protein D8674_004096 [Pyrus ussuriensis x Pyrus communis]
MASSAIKGRAWTRKEEEAFCRAYRWVLEDSVRGSSQTSEGVWTRWVLFEDPPQHRVGPTLMFETAPLAADMDEDGSLTIQQKRVENLSSGEGSIPRAMRRNKTRRLKEKDKANDDYAAQ